MNESTGFFSVSHGKKIKLRTPKFIYARLLFIYALLYTLSFIGGCLLFHFADMTESEKFNAHILSYFSVDFSDCSDIFDYALLVLSMSKSDIYHLMIIFSAGFTMLSGLIITSLAVFRGFSLGFSLSYLVFALRQGYITLDHPIASLVVYSVTCAVIAAIILNFSVKSALFCEEFKSMCGRPRKIIRSKALYAHISRFLIAFGAFLILNLFRCLL